MRNIEKVFEGFSRNSIKSQRFDIYNPFNILFLISLSYI